VFEIIVSAFTSRTSLATETSLSESIEVSPEIVSAVIFCSWDAGNRATMRQRLWKSLGYVPDSEDEESPIPEEYVPNNSHGLNASPSSDHLQVSVQVGYHSPILSFES
jgi:hypothetical protein